METLVRARIAEAHPGHHIIGAEHEVVWAIDPIDGTANFINGVPLFAASTFRSHAGASNIALEHWRRLIATGEREALIALEDANA